ncbi:MAG: hypothetical protein KGD60_06045 [Candidatus Thorarchaeota archaeon]|jgi:hypothetical protein|nr:hypothetical protein [Candidatus Thorarchaeota archaeon]
MKKNWSRKRGKNFLAYGWGRYGPYAVATRRVRRGVYAKTSIGLKGILAGLKHSNKYFSVQGMVNVLSGKTSVSAKRRRKRR